MRILSLGLILLSLSAPAQAETLTHTGEKPRNLKAAMEEKGYLWEIVYIGEYWNNTRGGLKNDSSYLSNLDVALTIDTEKAQLWPNGRIFAYGLFNHDTGKPSGEYVGSLQAISNIEAPRSVRLYELWYEHLFLEKKLSMLVGQHDFNSEFYISEYAQLFINGSFGIGPELTTNARPSVFPVASPALRLKYIPTEHWEFLTGIYDGDPGAATVNKHGTRWIFASDQGAFIASEIAYHDLNESYPGTYKVGFWHNTGDFPDLVDTDMDGNPIVHEGNTGGYFIADKQVYRETADQGLSAFLQIGGTPDNINQVDLYIGGGLHYIGLVPRRDADEAGIAFAYASISDKFASAIGSGRSETVLEITYRAKINEHFALQPDVQFVFNPGGDPELDTAVVAGLRFELAI